MAEGHTDVSIDIRSIQFINDGQYVLVVTLPDDQLEGDSDVKVSRDGVTFQDGRCLRSNIVEQDEPETTVEMKDNLFVFRLPNDFPADDDYTKLTLHVESYQLTEETQLPAECTGAGDEVGQNQLTTSDSVYRKICDGTIEIGTRGGDSRGNDCDGSFTNVIPMRRVDTNGDGDDIAAILGSLKYTLGIRPVPPTIEDKSDEQAQLAGGFIDEDEASTDRTEDSVGSSANQSLLSSDEEATCDATSAVVDMALCNLSCNNSLVAHPQQVQEQYVDCHGYLSDAIPLELESLPMGVAALSSTVLACVLPVFVSRGTYKTQMLPRVAIAMPPTTYPIAPTQETGGNGYYYESTKMPVDQTLIVDPIHQAWTGHQENTFLVDSTNQPWTGATVRPPTPWAYAPEIELNTKGEQLSVYRRSVDQMNIDVNRMNSRISQLETENEHLERNVCKCSSPRLYGEPTRNTPVGEMTHTYKGETTYATNGETRYTSMEEISKEHEMLMSQLADVPNQVTTVYVSASPNAIDAIFNDKSLTVLQNLKMLYKQQLDLVEKLRKEHMDRPIVLSLTSDVKGHSIHESEMSVESTAKKGIVSMLEPLGGMSMIKGGAKSSRSIDDESRLHIMAILDSLQARITSLESELAKNSRIWMKEKDILAIKVRERREAEGRLASITPLLPLAGLKGVASSTIRRPRSPPISIRHREDKPPVRTVLGMLSPRSVPLKTSLLDSSTKITSSNHLTTVTEPGVMTRIYKHPEPTFIRGPTILPPLIGHVSMRPETIAPRPSMLERSHSLTQQPVSIQSAECGQCRSQPAKPKSNIMSQTRRLQTRSTRQWRP